MFSTKQLHIAIDLDYAYPLASDFMYHVITILIDAGHNVFFYSTQRPKSKCPVGEHYGVETLFTSGHAVENWLLVHRIPVDIYVSAYVPHIFNNHTFSPTMLMGMVSQRNEIAGKVHIGMDYDGTYNADPHAFSSICDYALYDKKKYDMRIVTGRYHNLRHMANRDMRDLVKKHNPFIKTHFTQLQCKQDYLASERWSNFCPQIWFDDEPKYIIEDR